MCKRKLPTPVFWSREFHGLYSPWGRKESDTTEQLSLLSLCYTVGRCQLSILNIAACTCQLQTLELSTPSLSPIPDNQKFIL